MTTLLLAGGQRCTAACYNATRPECDCVCEGRCHGVGWARAVELAPDLVAGQQPGAVVALGLPLTSAHDGPAAAVETAPENIPGSIPAPEPLSIAKVDLRAPYTSDEWARITEALKAERERRSKRGQPFPQADQVAAVNEAVRPMREAALTVEAR